MKRSRWWSGTRSLAVILGLVNAACLNFRPAPTPVPPELAGSPPAEVWSRRASRGFTGPLGAADSVVYGAGYDRGVIAVRVTDGEVLWKARVGGPVLGGVAVGDSMVYVATGRPDGRLFAVRRRDGNVRWDANTGRTMVPVGLVEGMVVTHNQRGDVIAVDAGSGRLRWRARVRPGRSGPLGAGGAVIATGIDSIYRLDPASGTVLTRRRLPGAVLGGWVASGGSIITGTADSTVLALDAVTLEPRWSRRVDAPVRAAPLVRGDTVVVVSRRGTIYRLIGSEDPRLDQVAELRWPVTSPPVRFGDELVLGGADGSLRGYDRDGREQWRMTIWRPIDVAPLALDGALIAVGGNGDIYRLEP